MGRIAMVSVAAAVGGALWVLKAGAILAGAGQPEHLFELAPVGFAFATLLLAIGLGPAERRTPLALALVAVAASLLAGLRELVTGQVLGPAMMLGILAMLAALGLWGRRAGRDASTDPTVPRTAVALAVGTLPTVLLGGVLATIDERLLEVPILLLGLAWIAFGLLTWSRRGSGAGAHTRPSPTGSAPAT